jgi:hypothetical protein
VLVTAYLSGGAADDDVRVAVLAEVGRIAASVQRAAPYGWLVRGDAGLQSQVACALG